MNEELDPQLNVPRILEVYSLGQATPLINRPIPNFARTYTSFSGVDVTATLGGHRIAEIQGYTYKIIRDTMAPNNRRIEGTLTFIMFDRHSLSQLMPEEVHHAIDIPPFDIIITGQNEAGLIARMSIIGCQIMSEGSGIRVDDIINEMEFTYVAEDVIPWAPIEPNGN